jgi:tetratricopeptide (TPR) repeat protein
MIRVRIKSSGAAMLAREYGFGALAWAPALGKQPATLWVVPRRLALLLAGMFLVVWCGGAAAIWQMLHWRGYVSVGYLDLFWPPRWSHVGPNQAEDLLIQARHAAARGDVLQGLWLGKAAIRKDPGRTDAYELVGLLCARHWLMAEAQEYLGKGLEVGVPARHYLQLQLDVAQASDDSQTILTLTDRFWRSGWRSEDREGRLLLASQRARALLQLQRWDEALAWARELRALKPQPIVLVDVEAYALLQLGRTAEARALLSAVPLDFARQHDGVIRLLAEVHHRTGDLKAFRLTMRLYLNQAGSQPARHLDVLGYCRTQPDLQADYQSGLESYFTRFGSREDAMGLLAEFLLSNRALPELERLHEFSRSHLFQPGMIEIAYAQALLYGGEEQKAAAVLDRLPNLPATTASGVRVQFLRRLLATRATELANATAPLTNFLGEHPLPLDEALNLADLFCKRGRFEDAGQILDLTARNYPNSRRLSERSEQIKRDRAVLGRSSS